MESEWLADLYRDHRRQFLIAACAVLRRQDAAEDAVHAAFVRLVQLREPPRDPKLYAFKAVRNAALDLLSMHQRRREQPLELGAERAASAADAQDKPLLAAAAKALGQLDQNSREVVELHLGADLTFQEIANVLGQPLPTVASRYRRALRKLRQQLEVLNG
jgi:RNA polymerase sigma-70 factor (ECF subfamily)